MRPSGGMGAVLPAVVPWRLVRRGHAPPSHTPGAPTLPTPDRLATRALVASRRAPRPGCRVALWCSRRCPPAPAHHAVLHADARLSAAADRDRWGIGGCPSAGYAVGQRGRSADGPGDPWQHEWPAFSRARAEIGGVWHALPLAVPPLVAHRWRTPADRPAAGRRFRRLPGFGARPVARWRSVQPPARDLPESQSPAGDPLVRALRAVPCRVGIRRLAHHRAGGLSPRARPGRACRRGAARCGRTR